MQAAQFVKGTLVEVLGQVSIFTGKPKHAAKRGVVVKTQENDRGWTEVLVRFSDDSKCVVIPEVMRVLSTAEYLPKV